MQRGRGCPGPLESGHYVACDEEVSKLGKKGCKRMSKMLGLYGSSGNGKLLAKGGDCNKLRERQIGGKAVLAVDRRKAR